MQEEPQAPPEESIEQAIEISPEKVCFVAMKAREFDAKDALTDVDTGSNPTDDGGAAILEDHGNDPVLEEMTDLINSLSIDEQADLVALAWLGRGDYEPEDFAALREEALRKQDGTTARYLTGMPLLGDYLANALSMLGYSCVDFEEGRL